VTTPIKYNQTLNILFSGVENEKNWLNYETPGKEPMKTINIFCMCRINRCQKNRHIHMIEQLNMGVESRVRQEPKASVLSAYKICDLAYKILKV